MADTTTQETAEATTTEVVTTPAKDVPAKGTATLVQAPAEDKVSAIPADWPANWREKLAGEDERLLGNLKRFTDPRNLVKSWRDQREMISKSPPQKPQTEDAEKLKEWRSRVGLPEAPEGYLEKLPDGLVLGDDDKAAAKSFLDSMHASDVPPDVVHKALSWWTAERERSLAELQKMDNEFKSKSEDTLRQEWGADYRSNLSNIHNLFGTLAPEGLLDRFFGARLSDGTPVGSDPDALRFLAAVAKEVNPFTTVVPAGGRSVTQTIKEELAQLQKEAADSHGKQYDYWHNDEKQARLRELLEMEERVNQGPQRSSRATEQGT